MSHVRRFDHVGITVADLDTVTAFFVGLGLEVEGTPMFVEGEFLDTVIGIEVMMISAVMLTGESKPALARDAMFGVVMIVLNGMIGVSLLMGGLRHRERLQHILCPL